MIDDVDETLRRLIMAELPERDPFWRTHTVRVTFDPPSVTEKSGADEPMGAAVARVNVYLNDIRENTAMRSDEYLQRIRPGGGPADGPLGQRRPPVRLNLSYLITAHALPSSDGAGKDATLAADARIEHRLLSAVLAVLLRSSVVPERFLSGAVAEPDPATGASSPLLLSVAQPDNPSMQDPSSLWSALGGRLRPALGVVVVATFNPFETRWTRLVREAVIGVGQGTPASGNGPARPLDLRSVRVSVAGVVTDAEGSTPLAGVHVTVSRPDSGDETQSKANGWAGQSVMEGDGELAPTLTDERGFFSFLNLLPGPALLRFTKRGWLRQERTITVPPTGRPDLLESLIVPMAQADDTGAALQEQERLAGGLTDISGTIRLLETRGPRHVTISGTLRYPDGRPAAYIPVSVETSTGPGGNRRQRTTTTDSIGFYCFFDVPEPDAARLVAEVPGVGDVPLSGDMTGETTAPARKGPKNPSAIDSQASSSRDTSQLSLSKGMPPAGAPLTSIVPLPGSPTPLPEGTG